MKKLLLFFLLLAIVPALGRAQAGGEWQRGLVAGSGIAISGNTISASGTASISNDSTNASGDTIKIGTAQVQFFWIQYNSPGHYYINPGTQADAGKIIHIIALSAHADTVTALTDGYNANGSAQDATIGNGTPAIGSALVLDCGIDGHLFVDGATKNTLAP